MEGEADAVLAPETLVQTETQFRDRISYALQRGNSNGIRTGEEDQAGIAAELEYLTAGGRYDPIDLIIVMVDHIGDKLDAIAPPPAGGLRYARESGNIQEDDPREKFPAVGQGTFWQASGNIPDIVWNVS